MGCLWERRYGTDQTSPPRQKRIPIPTGQRTVRRNRKGRRPIRLQSPWEPSPKPDRKTGKERKNNQKDNKNAQKRGHRKPHPRQIRSPKPEYLYKTHTQSCIYAVYHTLRLSQTENQSEANGFTFGAQNGDDWPGTENGTAENGKNKHPGHGNTPQNRSPDLSERKRGTS